MPSYQNEVHSISNYKGSHDFRYLDPMSPQSIIIATKLITLQILCPIYFMVRTGPFLCNGKAKWLKSLRIVLIVNTLSDCPYLGFVKLWLSTLSYPVSPNLLAYYDGYCQKLFKLMVPFHLDKEFSLAFQVYTEVTLLIIEFSRKFSILDFLSFSNLLKPLFH